MSRSPSRSPPPKRSPKSTPFLCRIFTKAGPYHSIDLFQEPHTLPLSDEYAVYAWKTSTLSTLLASLYPSLPVALQNPGCKYSFRTIYFDARATMTHDDRDRDRERNRDGGDVKSRSWKYRELGRIDGRDLIRSCGEIEGAKTLEDLRYTPGDYLCLSIHPPASFPPQQQHDAAAPFLNQTNPQQQQQQPMMRINPRASFGNNSSAAPAAEGESWIDARNNSQSQTRSGGGGGSGSGGGFGIRGRGAPAAGAAGPDPSANSNSGWNGNGDGKAGNDDGWGSRPAARGETNRERGAGQQGGRRSASPVRTGNSGW